MTVFHSNRWGIGSRESTRGKGENYIKGLVNKPQSNSDKVSVSQRVNSPVFSLHLLYIVSSCFILLDNIIGQQLLQFDKGEKVIAETSL